MTDNIGQISSTSEGRTVLVSSSAQLLVFVFTTSMLISALLLFLVQPMFTKIVLPLLGGSSGVWNTAMVFFQAMLLGGYLYAHVLTRIFAFRNQIMVHGLVMLTSLVFLPIAIPQEWAQPVAGTPVFWLIGLFTVAVGMPFFALSANAPLMQKWFSYTAHEKSSDPYFLYAASNIGSLFSLLSYPVLIEPFFAVSQQTHAWAAGFVLLMATLLASGMVAYRLRKPSTIEDNKAGQEKAVKCVSWKDRVFWTLCALVPSGLMLAVTTHMTANIASAPLLWVLPLAIYLFTFISAFASKPYVSTRFLRLVYLPVAVVMMVSATIHLSRFFGVGMEIIFLLGGFYVITQYCHNRLAEQRPDAESLTEFYFFMSLGGVLGGASIALLAPLLFVNAHEFAIMLFASALVVSGKKANRKVDGKASRKVNGKVDVKPNVTTIGIAVALAVGVLFTLGFLPSFSAESLTRLMMVYAILLLVVQIAFKPFYLKPALYLVVVALLGNSLLVSDKSEIFADRSFFGISRVKADTTPQGKAHIFIHGNTIHNVQLRGEGNERYPLAYYSPEGSFGQAIDAVRNDALRKSGHDKIKVAAVGLGAGALACHAQDGDDWTFYEIDALVEKMARNDRLFSFMEKCGPDMPVEIGDARLTLEKADKGLHDLVIIDAFSSDAVPAHLMTREALDLYRSLIKPGGVIFFHTTNRNLDITSVALNVAKDSGLGSRVIAFRPDSTMKHHDLINASNAVLVGNESDLERMLKTYPDWKSRQGNPKVGVWSDDFTHIMGALLAMYFPNKE